MLNNICQPDKILILMGGFTFYSVSLDHVPQYSSCHGMPCNEIVLARNMIKKDTTFHGNSKCHTCTFFSGTVYAVATQFCSHAGTLFINILLSYETDEIETHFPSVSTLPYMFHTQKQCKSLVYYF
jgi:hypothetical protein